jgi:hypothetical protein
VKRTIYRIQRILRGFFAGLPNFLVFWLPGNIDDGIKKAKKAMGPPVP